MSKVTSMTEWPRNDSSIGIPFKSYPQLKACFVRIMLTEEDTGTGTVRSDTYSLKFIDKNRDREIVSTHGQLLFLY